MAWITWLRSHRSESRNQRTARASAAAGLKTSGKRFEHVHATTRYWLGVARYRLFHPAARRKFLETLEETFDVTKYHGMQLGTYRHHDPRPPHREKFPRFESSKGQSLSFSIVTPSYNQSQFVGQTIASVLVQNYPCLQYAVIDGGSKDGSQAEIERHASKLSVFVSEPDKGQSDAIAKGFNMITGDIMAYLNSDDLLMPGVLAYVDSYFQEHPDVDMIYGHRIIIDEAGSQIGRWILPPHSDRDVEFFDFVPQETMFWRRRIWEKVGGIDTRYQFAMDWDLILRFVEAGAKIVRLPYYLAYYRAHDAQKSHTIFDTRGQEEIDVLRAKVHANSMDEREFVRRHKWFRRKAVACAVLLSMGVRI